MAEGYVSDIAFSSDDDEEILNFIQRPARRPRVVKERRSYFEELDDVEFVTRFRLSKQSVLMVLDHIEDQLEYTTDKNDSLTPINQLLLTLRFFATGSHMITIGDFIGVNKSTACRCIHKVTNAIAALRPVYINLPTDPEALARIQKKFFDKTRFPRVIGCMDCTHIKLQSPGGANAEIFRNRKGYFSINVQSISDSELNFLDIVVRWPGSVHDTTIFNSCEKRAMFETGQYGNGVLLVDGGYPVRPYLLPPLDRANTVAEQRYNECQIRTRNCVERKYGVWKRRFPILALGMRVKVDKVLNIIVACAVLFNISRLNNDVEPANEFENLQERIDQDVMPNVPQNQAALANHGQGGGIVRQGLIAGYFQTLV